MKRSKIGAWLLVFLLAAGVISSRVMVRISQPIAETLAQAASTALGEDWAHAEALADSARARWETYWNFCAAFADHAPMENINGLFAQLEVYTRSRDLQNFAAVCAQLSEDTKAMGEAHSLTWWNLL